MGFVVGLIVMVMYLGLLHARYEGQTYAPKVTELKIVVALFSLLICWPFIGNFFLVLPTDFADFIWSFGISVLVLYLASTLLRKIVGLKVYKTEIILITAGILIALAIPLLLPAFH